MSIRQREDLEALKALGALPVQLPFCGAAYGTSYSVDEIAVVLAQYLDALNPESVLLPLGIFHPDHIATHKVAIRLIRDRPQIRWIIYEELPYRLQFREFSEAQKRELQRERFQLSDLTLPSNPSKRAKLRSIRRYRSQLRALGWNKILQALRAERYWRLAASEEGTTRCVPKGLVELKGYLGHDYDDERVIDHHLGLEAVPEVATLPSDAPQSDVTVLAADSAGAPYRSALRRVVARAGALADYPFVSLEWARQRPTKRSGAPGGDDARHVERRPRRPRASRGHSSGVGRSRLSLPGKPPSAPEA